MPSDEEQIPELVNVWMTATKQQDAETVRSLIADDAVFADRRTAPHDQGRLRACRRDMVAG